MPPPQQDEDVARDYRFLKLRLTDVKKSGRQAVIINNSCKTQVLDAAATLPPHSNSLPKGARGQKNITSPIGEGEICHPELASGSCEMLKLRGQSDVQHDENNHPLPQSLPRGRETEKLYSRFNLHSSLKRKAAFTLAEVLITLGIIGVVAAMTMPVIIQNTRGKALQAQLKKAYSVLSQATQQFITDEAQIPNPQNFADPENQFFKPLAKYFNGGSYCSKSDCQDIYDKIINSYKNYPKNTLFSGTGSMENCLDDGFITTNDSMLIVFDRGTCQSDRFLFSVDINGVNKAPNALGHDFFVFEVEPEKGTIIPSGGYNSAYTDETCRINGPLFDNEGIGCTAKALLDNEYFNHLP